MTKNKPTNSERILAKKKDVVNRTTSQNLNSNLSNASFLFNSPTTFFYSLIFHIYIYELEHHTVNQRFNEMNKQISELTSLVIALTEKITSNEKTSSSNREGNNINTVSIGHETRSDMVTGATAINHLPNLLRQSTSQYPQPFANQFDNIVTEIHHLRDTMTDTVQHPKKLHTQVPHFRGNREK